MTEKARKAWYQKGLVQAAFVSGAFALAVIYLRPPNPVAVHIQAPPQSVATPVPNTPEPSLPQSSPVGRSRPAEDSRAVKHPERTRSAEPPHVRATQEVGQPKALANGKPWFLSSIATAITVSFRETLGSHYVEIMVAPPEDAPTRFPARSAGATRRFSSGQALYEVQVLAIDWDHSGVNLVVRAVPNS